MGDAHGLETGFGHGEIERGASRPMEPEMFRPRLWYQDILRLERGLVPGCRPRRLTA